MSVTRTLPHGTSADVRREMAGLMLTCSSSMTPGVPLQNMQALVDGYLRNADLVRREMGRLGYHLVGGENSPYIWIKTGEDAWAFFDRLLNEAGVVTTPGEGFGSCGKGYIRISAFNSYANVQAAMQRIEQALA